MAINEHGLAELGCTVWSRFHVACAVFPYMPASVPTDGCTAGVQGTQRDWALCVLREFMLQSLICTDSARCGAVQWCLHALKLYLCIYAFGHACMPFEASGLVILPLILPGLAVFGLQFVFHYLIILIGVTARPRVFWTARTQQPGHFS